MVGVSEYMRASEGQPVVHILMATHQGALYLEEQLDSIWAQTHLNWVLHVSDDGSSDTTLDILKAFTERHALLGRVHLHSGPQLGASANFLHLVSLMKPILEAEGAQVLFAFCDQDDVWLPEKLERAVQWHLSAQRLEDSDSLPQLYASTTLNCDEHLRVLGESKEPRGPLTLEGALIQNLLSGNTMVMNGRLLQILSKVDPAHVVWHDWTAYLLASACGGVIHVDPRPSLLYRQHASNVIGAPKTDLKTQSLRLSEIAGGRYKAWNEKNLQALQDVWSDLLHSSQVLSNAFQTLRQDRRALVRLRLALASGLKREGLASQLAFWLLCALGWV